MGRVRGLVDLASGSQLYLEERVGRVRSLVEVGCRIEFYFVPGLVKN